MLKVNLFFDESGKNDDAVKTMGRFRKRYITVKKS